MSSSYQAEEIVGAVFLAIFLIVVTSIVMFKYVRIVQYQTAIVIEHCGVFKEVLEPGCHCLMPCADKSVPITHTDYHIHYSKASKHEDVTVSKTPIINLREQIIELPRQPVITRDNVQLLIHPMAFIKIDNPILVVYETADIYQAISILLSTTIRGIIGQLTLDDTLASREEIKRQTHHKIHLTCKNWGIELLDVDLLEIDPPQNILTAMAEQLTSERLRRKMLVEADGNRQRCKIYAEGQSQVKQIETAGQNQSQIIINEATAIVKRELAAAQADSIKMISDAVKASGLDSGEFNIYLQWLKTVEHVVNSSEKVKILQGIKELAQLSKM
ncbi:SPFH_domain/Band 7 family protein [Hexamita inflata]|uniref:SPFH domain/Band 7 family protein n=1 Tax=Hexamita inflata TaxID=28002 RepID=A0AA86ULF4_9EUKA|nr:SPFH domain/Band 7 family protein [Hexamita inflata]